MKILVVRFRQMGDAILTTVVLNSLKKSFPDCSIDFVLNDRICPLFEGHPSINRLIPFTDEERHSFFKYIRKVWHVVHSTHYDVIIDMRSTMNTMLFALFSPSTPYRIGLNKGYCKLAFNHLIERSCAGRSMIEFNLSMLKPLEKEGKLIRDEHFSLYITEEEQKAYDQYLQSQGIDLTQPILLAGVTAKLDYKTWNEDRMAWTIQQFIKAYPQVQIIFTPQARKKKTLTAFMRKWGSLSRYILILQQRASESLWHFPTASPRTLEMKAAEDTLCTPAENHHSSSLLLQPTRRPGCHKTMFQLMESPILT